MTMTRRHATLFITSFSAFLLSTAAAGGANASVLLATFGGADGVQNGGDIVYCLSGTTTNHDLATQYDCTNAPFTLLDFNSDGTITTQASGFCLDVWGNNPNNGTVDWTTCNGTQAQKWTYFDGQLVPFYHPGYCLTVNGNGQGSQQDGTQIIISPCSSTSTSQLFAPIDAPLRIQSPQYGTCMESPWQFSQNFVLGGCDSNNHAQDFQFGVLLNPPVSQGGAIQYNLTLETLAPWASGACVGWDGRPGDYATIDTACQGQYYSGPIWEYWRYNTQHQLQNAFYGTCLDLNADQPNNDIDEWWCGSGNQAQIWNIWINGFPTAPCRGVQCAHIQ
jgi:hypothetical protein